MCRAVGAEGLSGAHYVLLQGLRPMKHCPIQRLRPVTPGSNDSSIS